MGSKKGHKNHYWKNGKKVCPQCLTEKSEDGYYRCGNGQFMSWCKECCARLRPQKPEYFSRYYQANKEKRKAQDRERHYGVASDEYEFVWEAQGKVCGICSSKKSGSKHGWHTDHDHTTGRFRGILCAQCNSIVTEHATIDILLKSIEYLKQNQVVEIT